LSSGVKSGIVYLVGAGPGDPGLITVRGARLLELTDVVVYDALANPALLSYCPQAETIYVGKTAAAHSMTQDQINALLVEQGLAGKRVVRLKGGDPFVFGRGGEEAEALVAAGVKFEVVPGITAAIGASAYAGIPVTHRDFNSSFTVITGHEKEEEYRDPEAKSRDLAPGSSDIDWSAISRLPCVAFYMGVKALPRICQKLIEHGMPADTPAATIHRGTQTRQRTVVATIGNLPQRVVEEKIAAPAITIVGRVVQMRQTINWFETRPLFGKTVLVTRTRQQASELSLKLAELGASVIEAPTIETYPADLRAVGEALQRIAAKAYDWLVFTSANGVTHVKQAMAAAELDVRIFAGMKLAAIGDATASALHQHLGLRADLLPQRAVAEALADELSARGEVAGKRFALLRADIGRPILVERLEAGGAATVDDIAIYETRPAATLPAAVSEAVAQKQIDWITFTSSSTAKNLAALLGDDYREQLDGIHLASIGPVTTESLRQLGLSPTVESDAANIDGLVQAIRAQA
jgi:uroporphyrinogen III methyltransferase / synthase